MRVAFLLLIASLAWGQQGASRKVGAIDFFGYSGLDMAAIRAAVPLHVGDPFDPEHFDRELFSMVMEKALGHKPTDLGQVCCDAGGNFLLYIGVGGKSYQSLEWHKAPGGKLRLSSTLKRASEAADKAFFQAVMDGKAEEDDSQGFALLKEPKARAKLLDYHKAVLREEKSVYEVLANSADDEERADAARAVGYADRSGEQIAALVEASLDPASSVRNNAIRALDVLVEAFPDLSAKVPAHAYILLLSSGIWSDHNKASLLLERLTRPRDPKLLDELRAQALDSLVEMARWKNPGHAWAARMILGRMVAMDEAELDKVETREQVERIIGAAELGRR